MRSSRATRPSAPPLVTGSVAAGPIAGAYDGARGPVAVPPVSRPNAFRRHSLGPVQSSKTPHQQTPPAIVRARELTKVYSVLIGFLVFFLGLGPRNFRRRVLA